MSNALLGIVEGPAIGRDVPAIAVSTFVRECARTRPNAVAMIEPETGRSLTYDEIDRRVGRCAAGLAARGFRSGDTLVMFAPNSADWPIAALGAMTAGGVVSGANPNYGAHDLADQIREVGARFVFTAPPYLATVRDALTLAGPATILLLGDADATVNFDDLLACPDAEPDATIDPDALAALPYSSGTSGLPKGVMLTHRTIMWNICQMLDVVEWSESEVLLAILPMYHIYGFTVMTLFALAAGGTIVVMPRFERETFLDAIATYRVTTVTLVPPVLNFLATSPLVDQYDLSSLKRISCGAAPLAIGIQQQVIERLKCDVLQGFGMTESSGVVSSSQSYAFRPGASGRLLPNTQARIIDPETGWDLPRGSAGELWFRGPQAFKGYLNRPDATAATLTGDGWVHTGDIGHFDLDGYLYITDRLKELIKVNGLQVPPAELEALLLTHPAVADVAVIGRPDEKTGEIPVAYIVGREPFDPAEIKAWVAQRVIAYKQLGEIVTVDTIPKSPAGKILRKVLRAADAERAVG